MVVVIEYFSEDGDPIQIFIEGPTIIDIKEKLRPGDSILGLITELEYDDGEKEYLNLELLN